MLILGKRILVKNQNFKLIPSSYVQGNLSNRFSSSFLLMNKVTRFSSIIFGPDPALLCSFGQPTLTNGICSSRVNLSKINHNITMVKVKWSFDLKCTNESISHLQFHSRLTKNFLDFCTDFTKTRFWTEIPRILKIFEDENFEGRPVSFLIWSFIFLTGCK